MVGHRPWVVGRLQELEFEKENRDRGDRTMAGTESSILREVHLQHIVQRDDGQRIDDRDLAEVPRKAEGMELELGASLVP